MCLTRGRVLIQFPKESGLAWDAGGISKVLGLVEAVNEVGFEGYYSAHVPSLDLTTHGRGIEGALQAGRELVGGWVAEKQAHGETIPRERHSVIAQIEVADAIFRP